MGVWRISGYVGYPIGNWMIQKIHSMQKESEEEKCRQAKRLVGTLCLWMCWLLMQWHIMNPVGFPHFGSSTTSAHKWHYLIGLWVVETALQGCMEAMAVLAVLSGVVKIAGRRSEQVVPVDVEKQGGRSE